MKIEKKRSLSQMHSSVASVLLLFLKHKFCFGGTFSLGGTKVSFGTHFAQNSGVKTKKKKKSRLYKCTQWRRSCCFLLEHDFLFGGKLSFGGTKAFFGSDFALTFGGENQKQKKVFISNASHWCWSCCFLLGHNSRWGANFSLGEGHKQ